MNGAPSIETYPGPSPRARALALFLKLTIRPLLTHWPFTPRGLRLMFVWDALAALSPTPRGVRISSVRFAGFRGEWVRARGASRERIVLYFHGGAFMSCGLRTHRRLVSAISRESGADVLHIAYRQLPKARLDTSIADCVAAYRWLLAQGHDPSSIVVAGDSAGGTLAFAALLRALEEDLPMPSGIVALAPLLDYDSARKLAHANAALDPFLPAGRLTELVSLIVDAGELPNPIEADLARLPASLIQVASTELLRCDGELMAERLAAAGVPATLQIWEGQVHVFQAFAVPEAAQAIAEIGAFIRQTTARAATPLTQTA